MRLKITLLFYSLLFTGLTLTAQEYWKKSTLSNASRLAASENLHHDRYQIFSLDVDTFKSKLVGVTSRSDVSSKSQTILSFPNSSGKMEKFLIYETHLLAPDIAARYPNIKTYIGFGIDNEGSRIRFSVTPQGVQTMTSYLDQPNVFTVPVEKGKPGQYISYDRGVRVNTVKKFQCLTEAADVPIKDVISSFNRDANDQILRTFRIAISTNGEYTNFWDDGDAGNGDAQEDALAQVVSTLNRSNEVFEVDMAITFQLVTGTELIYPNAATDPYTGSYNSQLQSTLTAEVGEANYDIGHLFVYGNNNGNAGCIGCVCEDGQKGSGFSEHSFLDNDGGAYMSDFFDIDYVPHEIGHQMGANHTFSHSTEGTGVNTEPGSGTTIMGYAGITGSNDVQDHSDPYFHYHSIRQILDNVENSPNNCWTSTAITNNPPIADAGNDYTIPQGTAFVLRGAATDADGSDVLTYTWEQVDNGQTTSNSFGPTKTTGGVWRSRPPSTNPNRYMPILPRILAGELTETNPTETTDNSSWETVSTVSRDLNFALTVRDRSEENGVGQFPQSSFDLMTVTVDGSSGPFVVTSQATAESWNVGDSQTITWDVAGTNGGSVNTPTVNIKLSTDGGATFPYTLATGVSNDGSHTVTIPATGGDTTMARIMVEGNNNIFLAVNSANISIQESEFAMTLANPDVNVCSPDNAVYDFTYNTFLGFTGTTTFSAVGLPSGATATFSPATASADGTAVVLTVSGIGSVAQGTYNFLVRGTSGSLEKDASANLGVFNMPTVPVLSSPANGSTGAPLATTLEWGADANAVSFDYEVATDSGFSSIVQSGNVATNSVGLSSLSSSATYYWRVRANNACGASAFSAAYSFTTISCTVCESVANTTYDTSTTRVIFNTIDNASGKPSGYSDYTSISTEVDLGQDYDLTVQANTDGNYTTHTIVWIDWNQDCDFDDANETYDLGIADNVPDGVTSLSPVTVTVPTDAVLGSVTMRVSTRYNSDPTPCQNGADAEVEDYTVVVVDATASIDDFAFEGFKLYPNPSNGDFQLSFETVDTESASIKISDVTGRTVYTREYSDVGNRFAENLVVNNISSGIYLLQISNGDKMSTRKLVIE
uniref:Fibronectin type-III domain-containing protein n=1 Tax=Leptocylindrus danicus TaxID=163516 RepID=A0A7S2PMH9_9STRA|mmetsp:Transcript_5334/g.7828  ORF Transcript_5334/g.7828 Transcript_5334/m.7828 type:complete len:1108 (+) Transcript_5334:44-3367(+)